jgi:hypothetical protein
MVNRPWINELEAEGAEQSCHLSKGKSINFPVPASDIQKRGLFLGNITIAFSPSPPSPKKF